jgi:hypothetical protein
MIQSNKIFIDWLVSMEVSEDTLLSDWFFNKELSFALGVSFASCRIGSSLTSFITPKLY